MAGPYISNVKEKRSKSLIPESIKIYTTEIEEKTQNFSVDSEREQEVERKESLKIKEITKAI